MSTVIKAENISKIYRLGHIGVGNMAEDIQRFTGRLLRNKVRRKYFNEEDFNDDLTHVALRDVSFDVKDGEVIGIIGKNGAGKSTLLKILSRITSPTTGIVRMKGRVASLLEVGTGFHPELSGRENIFLNGAILGMHRHEIKKKLEEIVDFSGVGKFIDTPVKRYSSGMYVRLAFAVAAHLEPEILIVDEVLAVGDIEFQKKCLGKMNDVSINEGRTVLFVSHSIKALQTLCKTGILLENGKIIEYGSMDNVIDVYLSKNKDEVRNIEWYKEVAPNSEGVYLLGAWIENGNSRIFWQDEIKVSFKLLFDLPKKFHLSFHLFTQTEDHVFNVMSETSEFLPGEYLIAFKIPGKLLNEGKYIIHINFIENTSKLTLHRQVLSFEISPSFNDELAWYGQWPGIIRPSIDTVTKKITQHS